MNEKKLIELQKILSCLNIGSKSFWEYIIPRTKIYPLDVQDFPWACFPKLNNDNILINIRVLVPVIKDEATLLVNIHEFTHAYELYENLGLKYIEDINKSEFIAVSKEKEYLTRIKNKQ